MNFAQILTVVFFSFSLFAHQDDVGNKTSLKTQTFLDEAEAGFLSQASSDLWLSYYLLGESFQKYRAGALGDVVLWQFTPHFLWHWDLSMETLVDDKNDINFRLTRLFYSTKTGLWWRLKYGVLSFDYHHRCSHGVDDTSNRIWIRSGLNTAYQYDLKWHGLWLFEVQNRVYLLGQNQDLSFLPKAALGLNINYSFPITQFLSLNTWLGGGGELISQGLKPLYFITSPWQDLDLAWFYVASTGIEYSSKKLSGFLGLSLNRNIDSGVGNSKSPSQALSLDFRFRW